jgi:hypothetical protein
VTRRKPKLFEAMKRAKGNSMKRELVFEVTSGETTMRLERETLELQRGQKKWQQTTWFVDGRHHNSYAWRGDERDHAKLQRWCEGREEARLLATEAARVVASFHERTGIDDKRFEPQGDGVLVDINMMTLTEAQAIELAALLKRWGK